MVVVAKETEQEKMLRARLEAIATAEGAGPGEVPDRWERDPTWRCTNFHVSKQFEQGRRGRRTCTFRFCGMPVQLTFPEDRSGPLPVRGSVSPGQ